MKQLCAFILHTKTMSEVLPKAVMNVCNYHKLNVTVNTLCFESQSEWALNTSRLKGKIE